MERQHRRTNEVPVGDLHITQSNHADGLPNAQPDARGNAPVQASDAVVLVDVPQRLADRQVLGPVRILGLALHLDPDDLDGLVPGAQAAADARGQHLLVRVQPLPLRLARGIADHALGQPRHAEARAPVGDLADGDGIDALVDAPDPLLPVDVHERLEGAGRLDALRRQLVLRDLHRLHAGAEAHRRVRLRGAAHHAACDAPDEVVGAEGLGVVFGLGGDEEKNPSLGGGFDPGPGDEALEVCSPQSALGL